MKRSSLVPVAFTAVALVFASTGCKTHKPNGTTNIPNAGQPSAQNPSESPGGQVPNTPPPNATGIPIEGDSKWAKIWNGPHEEDRAKFQNDTVYFDFDSSTVKASEEGKLKEVADFFKNDSTDALQVEGNCDERGTAKYNLSLGERRALAIREYLANLGMDPQRVHTVTYGSSRPTDPGHNEEAWKKNRRGELVLLIPK